MWIFRSIVPPPGYTRGQHGSKTRALPNYPPLTKFYKIWARASSLASWILPLTISDRTVTRIKGYHYFGTHKGLYRYKQLMFGISCAPEMYQKVLHQVLQECDGAHNILDDVIVNAPTEEEHDKRFENVVRVVNSSSKGNGYLKSTQQWFQIHPKW